MKEVVVFSEDTAAYVDGGDYVDLQSDMQSILERSREEAAPYIDESQLVFYRYERKGVATDLPVWATLESAADTVAAIYVIDGTDGVDTFFRRNRILEPDPDEADFSQVGPIDPALLLPKQQYPSYKLLNIARRAIERAKSGWTDPLSPRAAEWAFLKLDRAADQIVLETRRYFGYSYQSSSDFDVRFALEKRAHFMFSDSIEVDALLNHAIAARKLWVEFQRSAQAVKNEINRIAHEDLPAFYYQMSDAAQFRFIESRREQAKTAGSVLALNAEEKAAREELAKYVMTHTRKYPLLWRLYKSDDVSPSRSELASEARSAVHDAYKGNRELRKEIEGDNELVWSFPPLMRQALRELEAPSDRSPLWVSQSSMTWKAAQERWRESGGLRADEILSMGVAVTHLAAIGVASLYGLALGPVGLVLAFADVVLTFVNIAQEISTYLLRLAAFNAVLDPSLSLGQEPSWFLTMLFVTADIVSLGF